MQRIWSASVASLSIVLVTQCGDSGTDSGSGPISSQGGIGTAGVTAAAGAGGSAPSVPMGTSAAGAAGQTVAAPTAGTSAAGGNGGASGSAGDGGGGADAGMPQEDAATPPGPQFPSVADPGAEGPFAAVTIQNSGPGGGYTVYHPDELAPDGLLHPLLTWGNGATTTPGLFPLLPHLATHGFVVIASNNSFVTGQEMIAGIDWLIEENERAESTFYQKLDPSQVASFGYSLGSLGTFEIAADPRIRTTVHISGGAMDKAVVPNLKNPAAFFCGDASDIAHDNCESDFELAMVPVFYGVFPGDHLGILGSHTDQITHAVTGWLRWRLMHDASFEPMFVGADCSLCSGGDWLVKQKDFDVAP
jgi:hypothetical protein